jgi:predicted transcriptional regulator
MTRIQKLEKVSIQSFTVYTYLIFEIYYMTHRFRYDIFATMLEVASSNREDATKAKIMNKSLLSYTQLKEYLALLVENDLIEEFHKEERYGKHEKAFYKPTDKGKRFMFLYKKINDSFL